MGEKLYELVRDGAIVQGLIALASTAAVIYLAVAQIPESQALLIITGAAVGHYFSVSSERRAEQRMLRAIDSARGG